MPKIGERKRKNERETKEARKEAGRREAEARFKTEIKNQKSKISKTGDKGNIARKWHRIQRHAGPFNPSFFPSKRRLDGRKSRVKRKGIQESRTEAGL